MLWHVALASGRKFLLRPRIAWRASICDAKDEGFWKTIVSLRQTVPGVDSEISHILYSQISCWDTLGVFIRDLYCIFLSTMIGMTLTDRCGRCLSVWDIRMEQMKWYWNISSYSNCQINELFTSPGKKVSQRNILPREKNNVVTRLPSKSEL